jgi:hypothetical protein
MQNNLFFLIMKLFFSFLNDCALYKERKIPFLTSLVNCKYEFSVVKHVLVSEISKIKQRTINET